MKVQHKASLHEKAVQAVARGDVLPAKGTRRRAVNSKVETFLDVKVDERVWTVVREQHPDPRCIDVLSPTDVILWNSPAQRERMRKLRELACIEQPAVTG